ncbi:hypothetical protein RRG08_004828, partial [Elysia crispata]
MGENTNGVVSLASDKPVSVVAGSTSGSGAADDKGGNQADRTFAPIIPHSMLGRTHVVLRPSMSRSLTLKVT